MEKVEDIDTDDTQIMKRLVRPLFNGGVSLSEASEERVDISNTIHYYGITINVLPCKRINNKEWRTYNNDQQRSILLRMENSIRRNNPSVELDEMHFEVCPKKKNVHFHALYKMPIIFISTVRAEWDRLIGPKPKESKNQSIIFGSSSWNHFHITTVFEHEKQHWLDYIRKDLKT